MLRQFATILLMLLSLDSLVQAQQRSPNVLLIWSMTLGMAISRVTVEGMC